MSKFLKRKNQKKGDYNVVSETKPFLDNSKEDWKRRKKEQLNQAYKLISEMALSLTDPNKLLEYLNVQSRFDKLSVGNALLIARQLPNAIQLKDFQTWKSENVCFKKQYPDKIFMLEPGTSYLSSSGKKITPFIVREVIDISQTDLALKPKSKHYDKKLVLQALLHEVNVDIKVVDDLEDNKYCKYDKNDNVVYVKRGNEYDNIISSVAKVIAKKDYEDSYYSPTSVDIEHVGECVGYLLCKKYDIETEVNNIDEIAKSFDKKNDIEVKNYLSQIKSEYDSLANKMYQYLEDHTKKKEREYER